MDDPHDLQRFIDAQSTVIDEVRNELRAGRKRSHWMWFIFPQMKGLGFSEMARRFGIASLAEAQAYLAHPVLGPRLRECTQLVTAVQGKSALEILGSPDDQKFCSSVTLFARATTDNQVFLDALNKYYRGTFDAATLKLLGER